MRHRYSDMMCISCLIFSAKNGSLIQVVSHSSFPHSLPAATRCSPLPQPLSDDSGRQLRLGREPYDKAELDGRERGVGAVAWVGDGSDCGTRMGDIATLYARPQHREHKLWEASPAQR